jgi:hypothetical protein
MKVSAVAAVLLQLTEVFGQCLNTHSMKRAGCLQLHGSPGWHVRVWLLGAVCGLLDVVRMCLALCWAWCTFG